MTATKMIGLDRGRMFVGLKEFFQGTNKET